MSNSCDTGRRAVLWSAALAAAMAGCSMNEPMADGDGAATTTREVTTSDDGAGASTTTGEVTISADGAGASVVFGPREPDGTLSSISGFRTQTDEGELEATLDDQGRVTSVRYPSGSELNVTNNDDGSIDYEIRQDGQVLFSGDGVIIGKLEDLAKPASQAGGDILDCVTVWVERIARHVYGLEGQTRPGDDPLVEALISNKTFNETVLAVCALSAMRAAAVKVDNECDQFYYMSPPRGEEVCDLAGDAKTTYTQAHLRHVFIAIDVARNIFISSGLRSEPPSPCDENAGVPALGDSFVFLYYGSTMTGESSDNADDARISLTGSRLQPRIHWEFPNVQRILVDEDGGDELYHIRATGDCILGPINYGNYLIDGVEQDPAFVIRPDGLPDPAPALEPGKRYLINIVWEDQSGGGAPKEHFNNLLIEVPEE